MLDRVFRLNTKLSIATNAKGPPTNRLFPDPNYYSSAKYGIEFGPLVRERAASLRGLVFEDSLNDGVDQRRSDEIPLRRNPGNTV